MPHECTNETALIIDRINAREVAMIQSGEANWYEVTIAQRTADGEVIGHEYILVCARNAKAARAGARGAVKVEREYSNPYATVAYVRRLAYRGNLHPEFSRENQETIVAAGYYRT